MDLNAVVSVCLCVHSTWSRALLRMMYVEINKYEHKTEVSVREASGAFGRIKAIPLAVHSRAMFFPLVLHLRAKF